MTPPGGIPQSANFFTAIIQSIFPGRDISTSRDPFRSWFNSLLLHFRPRKVPARTLKFTLTWGLGGTALVLIGLLLATGLLLKFAYRPSPEQAYASVEMIQYQMRFGGLIRNVHHWSGHLLVLVAFLHFLRVFFSGAFHAPRQFNWIIGLGLLGTVLLANFSGYLLPWDQLSYWAITICIGMLEYIPAVGPRLQQFVRGGAEVGPETLANFFALHTALLPALLILLLPFHFWRIRKAKGLVVPRAADALAQDQGPRVPAIPNLLLREVVVALVAIAAVLVLALWFDAPLADKANPGLSPNPTRAPWYFAGFQELLLHFHPLLSLFVMPFTAIIGLLAIPY
ncbi:MAG: cytochrome b N-terminal domain-containing protein, partial [Desulfobacterales bacterium]